MNNRAFSKIWIIIILIALIIGGILVYRFWRVPSQVLTLEALRNVEYYHFPSKTTIQMKDGHFLSGEIVPGTLIEIYVDKVAFGDFNADNRNDAAVILTTNLGETKIHELAIMINHNGEPHYLTSQSLFDREALSLTIESGLVILDMIIDGKEEVIKYKVFKDGLRKVEEEWAIGEEKLAILSDYAYVDDLDYFHVVGEVKNTNSQNLEEAEVKVTFFDEEGTPVIDGRSFVYIDVLQPEQKAPFEIIFHSSPSVANYKLEANYQITNRQPYKDIEIEESSLQPADGGYYSIVGEIRNTGDKAMDTVYIVATLYDVSKKVVGASWTFSEKESIKPGENSTFSLVLDPQEVAAMDSYTLQVEGRIWD